MKEFAKLMNQLDDISRTKSAQDVNAKVELNSSTKSCQI
jgi:hypothetical protein